MTLRDLLAEARPRLAATSFATGREANLLLAHLLGIGEAQLLARDDEVAPAALVEGFRALVARRLAGEPAAYLVGTREFWGRPFRVDRRALVPRPETEHLVEAALALPLPPSPRLLDLGTGSGCVAITLALELPTSRVAGVDRSLSALGLARANAAALASPVELLAADWTSALRVEAFDLLVANPPYLDPATLAPHGPVQREVADWEPAAALWAGTGGLDAYRALLAGATAARPGTPLLLELGEGQLEPLAELAPPFGWELVAHRRDLAGIARVAELRRRT